MSASGLSVRPHEPLARHTAHRTGGPCDAWVVAHDVGSLVTVLRDCRAVKWRVTLLGAGTRTVVKDGPMTGAVVRLGQGFAHLDTAEDHWQVGAATPVPALVSAAMTQGRSGVGPLACTPGSVGASLLHDEGWDEIVVHVDVIKRGKVVSIDLDEARRRRPTVVGAELRLPAGDPVDVTAEVIDALGRGRPSPPGSWYVPPKRGVLRELLISVRLPMVRLRRVAIPESAPELLVNLGEGRAADMALLHRSAVERVDKVRGERLATRVRWIGTASA